MEITNIDPMQNVLLFERFLNPERVTMPDIDVDFCQNRRGEVIEYVTRKYGREQVAQIITFNTMAAKASIKDCGRALDMPYGDVDRIAKLVPDSGHDDRQRAGRCARPAQGVRQRQAGARVDRHCEEARGPGPWSRRACIGRGDRRALSPNWSPSTAPRTTKL